MTEQSGGRTFVQTAKVAMEELDRWQQIGEDEARMVYEMTLRNELSGGTPVVREFEATWRQLTGSPYALSVARFVEVYGEIFGVTVPIDWIPAPKFYGEYLPDVGANYHFSTHMAPDISKTRAKLGYAPEFTSEQSMARAIAWMREKKLI